MKRTILSLIVTVTLIAACGGASKSAPSGSSGSTSGQSSSAVTWSSSDQQSYLTTCGWDAKTCNCSMQILQQNGTTFAQYQANPSLAGQALISQQMTQCLGQ